MAASIVVVIVDRVFSPKPIELLGINIAVGVILIMLMLLSRLPAVFTVVSIANDLHRSCGPQLSSELRYNRLLLLHNPLHDSLQLADNHCTAK